MSISVYNGGPAFVDFKTFYGNDDNIMVIFPFDTTNFEFIGEIVSASGVVLQELTVTKSTTGVYPNLVYQANFNLTAAQNEQVPPGSELQMRWIQNGTQTTTFIKGPFENPKL